MAMTVWGSTGNTAFAIPMVQQYPTTPATQGYPLVWDITNQALNYFPLSCDFTTGDMTTTGSFGLPTGKVFKINGTQVVAARDTGWTAMTGTPDKLTAYNTATVTLAQLAGRVAQLQATLTTHGLIGA